MGAWQKALRDSHEPILPSNHKHRQIESVCRHASQYHHAPKPSRQIKDHFELHVLPLTTVLTDSAVAFLSNGQRDALPKLLLSLV